ncbi:beta-microseminoprotein [Denticeps clupeoides]|uniref:beta-microseminoprotein n=1 Tax=Denticeps clupeoides TaxID=299321 RepID=UPI0010A3D529|nr:beta-microseminoprotein-like [Denticeps clupeoides]
MGSLLRGCVLLSLAAVCWGQCVFQQLEILDFENPPKGCTDESDKFHVFGASWMTKDCMECFCSEGGISCCNKIPTVVDETNCKINADMEKCTYEVVNTNPANECVLI